MIYLGIDPGSSGGIVALSDVDPYDPVQLAEPLSPSYATIWKTLWYFSPNSLLTNVHAYIESIPPVTYGNTFMPKTAVSSIAKLYGNYCALRMALYSLDIPFTSLSAKKWQGRLAHLLSPRKKGEETGKWKNRLKKAAQKLFPEEKITLSTADAFLLAYLCREEQSKKPAE